MTDFNVDFDVGLTSEELRQILDAVDVQTLLPEIRTALRGVDDQLLERLTVEYGGLLDPVGQFQAWLTEQLSKFVAWIVSAISPVISGVVGAITGWINQYIAPLLSGIEKTLKQIVLPSIEKFVSGVSDFFTKTLPGWFEGARKTFEGWLKDIGKLVESARSMVAAYVDSIAKSLRDLPAAVGSALKSAVESAQKMFQQVISSAQQFASAVLDTLARFQKSIASWIEQTGSQLGDISKFVASLFESAKKTFEAWLEGARKTLEAWIEATRKKWEELVANASKAVSGWIENARKSFESFLSLLANAPAAIEKAVSDVAAWVWERLPDWAKGFLRDAPKALEFVGATLSGFVNGILQFPEWFPRWFEEHISKPLQGLASWIWEHIPDWLKGGLLAVKQFFEDVYNWMKEGFEQFLKDPVGVLSKALTEAAKFIFNMIAPQAKALWDFLFDLYNRAVNFFNQIAKTGEVPKGSLLDVAIGAFWERMPDSIKWFFENIQKALAPALDTLTKFFNRAWESVQAFLKDPIGALRKALENAWNAIKGGFEWLGKEAQGFLSWLGELVKAGGSAIAAAGSALLGALAGAAQAAGSAIAQALSGIVNFGMGDAFANIAETVAALFGKVWSKFSEKIWQRIDKVVRLEEMPVSELAEIAGLSAFALVAPLGVRVISHLLQSIGRAIGEADINLRPLGIGIRIPIKPGVVLQEVGKYLWYSVEPMTRFFVMSYMAATMSPLGQWTRAMFRDVLPTYPIDPYTAIELARRHMPTPQFEEWREQLRKVLAYSAVPTMFERAMTSTIEDKYIFGVKKLAAGVFVPLAMKTYFTIKDRFGVERKIPTSLLYVLPSAEDVARMMVRDLFQTFDDYKRIAQARGVSEDISAMYFLHRFRYPSPDALYRFYARAMAGALWYTPPREVLEDAKRIAESVLGPASSKYMPKPAAALNVPYAGDPAGTAQKILAALTTYLKWHDFAPFAWIEGFTSDQQIVAELMADLPTRIDVRWMWKWQIPDALAQVAQVAIPGTVRARPSEWLLGQITIATGVHPRYVPFIVAAEMMNALTEERTFYRAGVIAALRSGFLDVKSAYDALRQVFTFKVNLPVYNANAMVYEWKEAEVPVVYLDPEVRLMLARASVDWGVRAIEAMRRQLMRMVAINYAKPEEYLPAMQKLAQSVSETVNSLLSALGARQVQLQYSEMQAAIDQQLIVFRRYEELLRRLRFFVRYSLYPLLSRFGQGYVSEAELDKYINDIAASLRMMDEEKKFLRETAFTIRDLAKRQQLEKLVVTKLKRGELKPDQAIEELVKLGWDKDTASAIVYTSTKTYVPTVSTLATLVELVPEAISMFNKVCDAQGVPEEERKYWLMYIQRKAVKDEISRLVTELISDYAYGKITDADWNTFMGELKKFGYTDEEIQILTTIAKLRRQRYAKAA